MRFGFLSHAPSRFFAMGQYVSGYWLALRIDVNTKITASAIANPIFHQSNRFRAL
jgi:hypothetical protein